ncbi:hypothetical protein K435DRAFT_851209 [Dendrothele bispora CBS 962.96]|uniref:Uncharacterized protein n=1 Tax=Dendrothele bispora (strain CBS 962.96) TaxID=1314807 RepID=A0A4S8MMS2_DENBC|nr:hypothetical protein K435DRAFT_851209 [Dendrothele bispora CBS 962.96]
MPLMKYDNLLTTHTSGEVTLQAGEMNQIAGDTSTKPGGHLVTKDGTRNLRFHAHSSSAAPSSSPPRCAPVSLPASPTQTQTQTQAQERNQENSETPTQTQVKRSLNLDMDYSRKKRRTLCLKAATILTDVLGEELKEALSTGETQSVEPVSAALFAVLELVYKILGNPDFTKISRNSGWYNFFVLRCETRTNPPNTKPPPPEKNVTPIPPRKPNQECGACGQSSRRIGELHDIWKSWQLHQTHPFLSVHPFLSEPTTHTHNETDQPTNQPPTTNHHQENQTPRTNDNDQEQRGATNQELGARG